MGDLLADAAERRGPVETPASDDQEIGLLLGGGLDECFQCRAMVEGRVRFPADPGSQVRVAIETAQAALAEFGAGVDDVVRTRMYVTHRRDCDAVGRVHADVFGANPPVATMVIVSGLLHPDMRVEIEVEAVLPESEDG